MEEAIAILRDVFQPDLRRHNHDRTIAAANSNPRGRALTDYLSHRPLPGLTRHTGVLGAAMASL